MNIGFFLGYAPHTVLKKEGLGRYTANLIQGFIRTGNKVTIACPAWLIKDVEDLLEDFRIEKKEIKFIVSNWVPVIWKIYDKVTYDKNKKVKEHGSIQKIVKAFCDEGFMKILEITNALFFILVIILLLAALIIALPLIAIAAVLGLLCTIFLKIKCKIKGKINDKNYLKQFGTNFRDSGYNLYLYVINWLQEKSTEDIVRKINHAKHNVDIWYSPSFFWKAFNKIEGTKVINAPDLVTSEFPEKFADERFTILSLNNIEHTIEHGDYFVVYCDFIKKTLLMNKFNKKSENVIAIPHGINSLAEIIEIGKNETKRFNVGNEFSEAFARSILQTLPPKNISIISYTGTFVFEDTKYLFYSSQARPHKNILNLIKAYEKVLRKRYYNVKLIMTCNLDVIPETKQYVLEKGLEKDILTFQNVTNQQLAALYYCAELVVNPTLYEGGFPFTFGEGMSVGTPSIMGKIPQVEDVVRGYDLEDCLFDPYNVADMENKIVYGLEHRDIILKKQQKLFDELNKRTWNAVAKEYLTAFETFISMESVKQGNAQTGLI